MEDLYLANCDYYSKKDNCKKIENVKSLLIQGEPLDEPPLISIAVPTFKRVSTLKGTIESAINQKGSHRYNIIVVDNNPERNDETEVFMREYATSYPTVLYYKNEQNIGMGGNWCRCMELADGKWVILIHDDDLLIEDYLNEIEPCLSDNIDGIFVMSSVFEDGKPLPRIQNPNQMRLFKKSIKDQYHFPSLGPSGNILKKSTVIELGCFDKDIFAPDAFFSKMAYYGNVYTTNKKLIYYRVGINESTKLSAMDKMCYQNHFHRIQTFEKLGIPKFIIKRLLLYSDIIFEKPFQTFWNKDFKYSSMPQYTAKEAFISKLFYKPVDFFLKVSRKIFRKTIIIN